MTSMTGLMESIVLAGVFAVVVFGAEPNLSEKSRNKGAFLSGLVAELSRNYSEKNVTHRVDSAAGRSTCK
jgi:hypothetical protein